MGYLKGPGLQGQGQDHSDDPGQHSDISGKISQKRRKTANAAFLLYHKNEPFYLIESQLIKATINL